MDGIEVNEQKALKLQRIGRSKKMIPIIIDLTLSSVLVFQDLEYQKPSIPI